MTTENLALFHASSLVVMPIIPPMTPKSKADSVLPLVAAKRCSDVRSNFLFDLVLEVLAFNQLWDIIIVFVLLVVATFLCLHRLVALGEFSEGGEGVGAKLVKDTRDKFCQFLVFTVTVDSEGVGWNRSVDCKFFVLARCLEAIFEWVALHTAKGAYLLVQQSG